MSGKVIINSEWEKLGSKADMVFCIEGDAYDFVKVGPVPESPKDAKEKEE